MTDTPSLADIMFADIDAYISEQRVCLVEGKDVQFTPLEEMTAKLCLHLEQLPREEGLLYQQPLKDLMESLSELTEALTLQKDMVKKEVLSLTKTKDAHKKYLMRPVPSSSTTN